MKRIDYRRTECVASYLHAVHNDRGTACTQKAFHLHAALSHAVSCEMYDLSSTGKVGRQGDQATSAIYYAEFCSEQIYPSCPFGPNLQEVFLRASPMR